jgi:glucose/arabinose dehydrogenase
LRLFENGKLSAPIANVAEELVVVAVKGDSASEVERIYVGMRVRAVAEADDGSLYVLKDGAGGGLLLLTPQDDRQSR